MTVTAPLSSNGGIFREAAIFLVICHGSPVAEQPAAGPAVPLRAALPVARFSLARGINDVLSLIGVALNKVRAEPKSRLLIPHRYQIPELEASDEKADFVRPHSSQRHGR